MNKKPRSKPHEAFAILLDVGSNSSKKLCEIDYTDFESSVQLLDWVISRKIFTESDDQFSLIFFGHEIDRNFLLPYYSNIYIYNEEYETAKIDWLKVLEKEISINLKSSGDYISGLFVGLESLKLHTENVEAKQLTAKTITLISNFDGLDNENSVLEMLAPITSAFKSLNVQLMVIGPDLTIEPRTSNQKIGFKFVKALLENVNGCAFSFSEGLSQLKFFVPKTTQPRAQPFSFELAKDFSIRMQMYIKNSEASMKLSFNPVSKLLDNNQTELKKIRQYETLGEGNVETRVNFDELDKISDEKFKTGNFGGNLPTGKTVEKSEIIRGYRYGKSLIPIGLIEQSFLEYSKEGKQLQLLQFTKLENILPQFLLSSSRYFLPQTNDESSVQAMYALVKAMLDLKVVALCRYAYNINSNPRVACLIPKISKKSNFPILIHYIMPFNEDLRYFEFPSLDKVGDEPTDYQLDVVDEYITSMLLSDPSGANERMRCKSILNPKHQYQCQVLCQKAINPDEPLSNIQRNKLLERVNPPKLLIEKAKEIIDSIRESFTLEKNGYTRIAAFKNKKNNSEKVSSIISDNTIDYDKIDIKNFD